MDNKNLDRLYATFDVVHARPLRVRDRQTGEWKQIGELSYITARQVMDRLDEVFGVLGWKVSFDAIDQRNVKCTLSVNVGGEWIAKEDFGFNDNENSADGGLKGAASDALKRAAVHFGIGRFLYDERGSWGNGSSGGSYQRQGGWQNRDAPRPVQRIPASKAAVNKETGEISERQPFKKPFGTNDPVERTENLLGDNGFTPEDFHAAFGVAYSPLIVANLIEEGWTPESIVGAVQKAVAQ